MEQITFSEPRRLLETDDVAGFQSGNSAVDSWLHDRAARAQKNRTAIVYVTSAQGMIAGFYSFSSQSLLREQVSGGWLRRNTLDSIPVILLGFLGVDKRFQGMGLGTDLLHNAIARCARVSEEVAAKAVVLDPYDDRARAFYEHCGFEAVPGTARMFFRLP